MSQIYKSGKKTAPKKSKEVATIDISDAFVNQLEAHLNEFLDGLNNIPKNQIPPKLKPLIDQIGFDVLHFIRQYRMTQNSFTQKNGVIQKKGNKSFDEDYLAVQLMNKKYKKEHGASKFMPHKLLLKSIEDLNKKRQEEGKALLREIGIRTYDSWKKRMKSDLQ